MASTSKEVSFLFWSTREEGELDGFGFPKASISSDFPAFDEPWSDISSKKTSKHENTHWFFDVNDAEAVPPPSAEKDSTWTEKDDYMLDLLLNKCGLPHEDVDNIPDLQWSSSFEEPAWDFANGQDEFSSALSREETFFSQEFRWNEAKFFDMEEAFTVASTETGSIFTDDFDSLQEDDISTLTASGIYTIETTESVESEANCWYRAKIASLFVPRKRAVMKMKADDLEVWPKKQASSHSTVETPLLIQVPPEELARRMTVMQERQEKQAQIENLAQSPEPQLRQDAKDELKELWITAYKKRPRANGLGVGSGKEDLSYA